MSVIIAAVKATAIKAFVVKYLLLMCKKFYLCPPSRIRALRLLLDEGVCACLPAGELWPAGRLVRALWLTDRQGKYRPLLCVRMEQCGAMCVNLEQ